MYQRAGCDPVLCSRACSRLALPLLFLLGLVLLGESWPVWGRGQLEAEVATEWERKREKGLRLAHSSLSPWNPLMCVCGNTGQGRGRF